jgi:ribosomal protein L4
MTKTSKITIDVTTNENNIPEAITVREINPVSLLKAHKVAVTAEAFKKIEEWIDA